MKYIIKEDHPINDFILREVEMSWMDIKMELEFAFH